MFQFFVTRTDDAMKEKDELCGCNSSVTTKSCFPTLKHQKPSSSFLFCEMVCNCGIRTRSRKDRSKPPREKVSVNLCEAKAGAELKPSQIFWINIEGLKIYRLKSKCLVQINHRLFFWASLLICFLIVQILEHQSKQFIFQQQFEWSVWLFDELQSHPVFL